MSSQAHLDWLFVFNNIMAKELPYFKFEPSEWENGNIQICTRDEKGLFIDLCSMYWSRLGDLPFKLALQKLCGGNASAFDSLLNEEIFTVIDGAVCIGFLNEQLLGFDNISEQNSKNAKEGWEKRRKQKGTSERNATALIPQCETDAIREEEIIEEKKKVDNNIEARKLKFANTLKPFIETYSKELVKDFYEYWTEPNKSNTKFKQELQNTWSTERRLSKWASNDKTFNNGTKQNTRSNQARSTQQQVQDYD